MDLWGCQAVIFTQHLNLEIILPLVVGLESLPLPFTGCASDLILASVLAQCWCGAAR